MRFALRLRMKFEVGDIVEVIIQFPDKLIIGQNCIVTDLSSAPKHIMVDGDPMPWSQARFKLITKVKDLTKLEKELYNIKTNQKGELE